MLKIENLYKGYFNRSIFQNVNIEIPSNQLTFIIGESGSGKSTLLNLIANLSKPNSGKITFEENGEVHNLIEKNSRELVDIVFQYTNLVGNLSALKNMEIGSKIIGKSWKKKESIENLRKLNIGEDVYKSRGSDLSGGEQQRICLARSIERESKILLVDEPTGNLDEESAEIVFQMLQDISKTKTVVVVTHDLENAQRFADNIFKVEEKNIVPIKISNTGYRSEAVQEETKKSKKESLKNKLSLISTLTLSDLKKSKFTYLSVFFSIFVTLLASLLAILGSFGSFQLNQNAFSSVNLDKAVATSGFRINDTDDDISQLVDKLKEFENVTQVVPMYGSGTQTIRWGDQTSAKDKTNFPYELIKNNDFFKNRLTANGLSGQILNNVNEVVIGKDISESFGGEAAIGKTIEIKFDNIEFEDQTLKIVGINNSVDFNGNYLNYIDADILNNAKKDKEFFFFTPIKNSDRFRIFFNDNKTPDGFITNPIIKQLLPTVAKGDEVIVQGSKVIDDTQFLISSALFDKWKKLDSNVRLGLNFFFTYYLISNIRLSIGGVFESAVDEIRVTQSALNEIIKKPINSASLYVNPLKGNPTGIFDNIKQKSQLTIRDNLLNLSIELFSKTYLFNIIVSAIGSIFQIITLVLLIALPIIISNNRKKENLLLKSLGAKRWQIVYYSLGGALLMFAILFFISLAIGIIGSIGIQNLIFGSISYIYPNYGIIFLAAFFIWLISSAIFMLIFGITSTITNIRKYNKLIG